MADIRLDDMQTVGSKSYGFFAAICIFAAAWLAVLIIGVFYLERMSIVATLMIVVSAAIILFCGYTAFDFLTTPSRCIRTDGEKIYFRQKRQWMALPIASVAAVQTFNDGATNSFNSLGAVLNRGTITLTDRRGAQYRIKYVKSPEEVKERIESFKSTL